jgi:hypothetical protein
MQLNADREFIASATSASNAWHPRISSGSATSVGGYKWRDFGRQRQLALPDRRRNQEPYHSLGHVTEEERKIINHHIEVTIMMLESLPWPKHLKNVPEYAGGHHERMDGRGYPRGLTRSQMSVQARVMGIADIFEALTAKDRPYKQGKTLTEALTILGKFKLNGTSIPICLTYSCARKSTCATHSSSSIPSRSMKSISPRSLAYRRICSRSSDVSDDAHALARVRGHFSMPNRWQIASRSSRALREISGSGKGDAMRHLLLVCRHFLVPEPCNLRRTVKA